ncbi:YdcH family protein [Flavobacterium sp.]|uniref:YdcH family protein n=1 Tax=Flavobacterium sp. TaxID=239 RepID=UPI003F69DCD4
MIKKHNLVDAFPEFENKIQELKVVDNHFKKMYDSYDELDHEIYRIESLSEPASDEALNNLRMTRVKLKDDIYNYLSKIK